MRPLAQRACWALKPFINGTKFKESSGKVLNAIADSTELSAEEKAAQLQLKLIFPLAIFIFPALCVVIMGPIWPTLAATNAAGV